MLSKTMKRSNTDLNRDYADAYCNRGSVYTSKGEFDRAIADLNEAIGLKP